MFLSEGIRGIAEAYYDANRKRLTPQEVKQLNNHSLAHRFLLTWKESPSRAIYEHAKRILKGSLKKAARMDAPPLLRRAAATADAVYGVATEIPYTLLLIAGAIQSDPERYGDYLPKG